MSDQIPKDIVLYRIIHKNNLDYLLRNGMYTRNHAFADPNYLNIGDNTLIVQRNNYPVAINPPGGNLGDYVPFYFGPLSPMLLNIKTGYRGITQRHQSDIIYVCCNLNLIIANCLEWCFTDGHAKNAITKFFNDRKSLNQVDWEIVSERYWCNTEEDYDRMRRKQAEFLVKNHVPVNCIVKIIVYDDATRVNIVNFQNTLGLQIPVEINPNNQYYYL